MLIGKLEFDVGEICSASQSGLRGKFVKYRSGCDDLDDDVLRGGELLVDGRRKKK